MRNFGQKTVLFSAAFVIIIGFAFTAITVSHKNATRKLSFIDKAKVVAAAINVDHIKTLAGTDADTASADYQRLKVQLKALRAASPNCRFIYLMHRKPDGTIIFFVDSEDPLSKDYSPPGQVYTEASQSVHEIFNSQKSKVEGPIKDRWGRWVSAMIPIIDAQTGKNIAVLGMDVQADNWNWQVISSAMLPIGLMFILLILGAGLFLIATRTSQLRESEEKFRTLMQQSPSAIEIYDLQGTQIAVNTAYELLWNLPASHTVGIFNLFTSKEVERTGLLEYVKKAYDGQPCNIPEYQFDATGNTEGRGLGRVRWLSTKIYPLKDIFGKVQNIVIMHEDVTTRIETEQELRASTKTSIDLIASMPTGIFIYAYEPPNTLRLLDGNETAKQLTGLDVNLNRGKTFSEIWDNSDASGLTEKYLNVMRTGEPLNFETLTYVDSLISGTYRIKAFPIQGNKLVVAFDDVTELKRAEETLRENENRLTQLFDEMLAAFALHEIICDENGTPIDYRFLMVNKAFEKVTGLVAEDILGKTLLTILPQSETLWVENYGKVALTGIPIKFSSFSSAFNKYFDVRAYSPEHGKFATIFLDITENVLNDIALRESETRYRNLADSGQALIWTSGVDKLCNYFNEPWLKFTGRTLEQELGAGWTEQVHPNDLNEILELYNTAFDNRECFSLDYRLKNSFGEYRWIQDSGSPIYNSKGEFIGYIGHCLDITDRKQAEQILRESEEKFIKTFRNSPDVFIITVINTGKIIEVNETFYAITGFTPQEIYGKTTIELGLWQSIDDRNRLVQALHTHKKAPSLEMNFRRKNGEPFVGIISAELITLQDTLCVINVIHDITDRVNAETAVRESEKALRKAQEVANVGSWVWHIQTNKLEWSDQMFRIFGMDKNTFSGNLAEVMTTAIHPDDRAAVEASNLNVAKNGKPQPLEYRIIHPDGTIRTVWGEAGEITLDETGQPNILTGIVQDITERKHAEQILRESEEKFNSAFNNSPITMTITSAETGAYVAVNSVFLNDSGFTRDEVIGHNSIELNIFTNPEDRVKLISTVLKEGNVYGMEMQLRMKNGTIFDCLVSTTLIYINAKPHFLSATMDITERKRAEKLLREKSHQLRAILDAAKDAAFLMETDGTIINFNDELVHRLGMHPSQIMGKNFYDLLPPDVAETRRIWVEKVIQTGKPVNFEDVRSGRNIDSSVYPIFDTNGKVARVAFFGRDITEKKLAEQFIRESEARYRLISDNVEDIVWQLDKDLRFVYASPAVEKVFGYSIAETCTMSVASLLDEQSMEQMRKTIIMRANQNPIPGTTPVEYLMRHKDGHFVPVEIMSTPLFDENKNIAGFVGVARNITERKKTEETLRKNAEEQQWLFKSMINAFVIFESVFDEDGKFISFKFNYFNDAYERVSGVRLQDVIGKDVFEVWPQTENEWLQYYALTATHGIPQTFDQFHAPTGKLYHCNAYRPWKSSDRFCVIFEDITELQKAREKIDHLSSFPELNPSPVLEFDQTGRLIYANFAAFDALVNAKSDDVTRFLPIDFQSLVTELKATPNNLCYFEITLGTEFFGEAITFMPLQKTVRIYAQNITERKTAEQILRESEQKFRTYVESAPDAIFIADKNGKYTDVNPAACKMLGYTCEELTSLTIPDIIYFEDTHLFKQSYSAIDTTGKFGGEMRLRKKDGTFVWVALDAANYSDDRYIAFVKDISTAVAARKKIEENEANLESLIENTDGSIWAIDTNHCLVIANSNFHNDIRKNLGREIAIGESVIAPFEDTTGIDEWKGYYDHVLSGERFEIETKTRYVSDKQYMLYHLSPIFDTNGKIVGATIFGRDISFRKAAEEALRASEEEFRTLFESAADGIAIHELSGKFILVNRVFCERLGYSFEELASQTPEFVNATKYKSLFYNRLTQVIQNGYGIFETELVCKNGAHIPMEVSAKVIDFRGRKAVLTITRDITERKKAELALREANNWLDKIINAAPNPIFVKDEHHTWILVNDAFCKFFGRSQEELINKNDYAFFTKQEAELFWTQDDTVIAMGSEHEWEERIIDMRGRTHFIITRKSRYTDASGKHFIVGMISDITEMKIAQDKISANQARLESLMKISQFNAATIPELLDFALDEAIALTESRIGFLGLYHDENQTITLNSWSKTVMEECTIENPPMLFELQHTGIWGEVIRSGKPLILNDFSAPHPKKRGYPTGHAELHNYLSIPVLSEGQIVAVVGVANKNADYDDLDVIQLQLLMDGVWRIKMQREAHEEVRTMNINLERIVSERTLELMQTNKELESFSYSVSHDLRAPLRSIEGFAHALFEDYYTTMNEDGRDFLNRIRISARKMSELIDDLLNLSRITRAAMRKEQVNLSIIVHTICAELLETEPTRAVDFSIEDGLFAACDANLVAIALRNLLSNAWKFTSTQERAYIKFGAVSGGGPVTTFYVSDNGTGFDMKYAGKLFEPFQRLHTHEFPGTGIGLSTVERIISRHGGEIWVKAAPNEGATFYFTL